MKLALDLNLSGVGTPSPDPAGEILLTATDGFGSPMFDGTYLVCPIGLSGNLNLGGQAVISLPPGTYSVQAGSVSLDAWGEEVGVVVTDGVQTQVFIQASGPFQALSC